MPVAATKTGEGAIASSIYSCPSGKNQKTDNGMYLNTNVSSCPDFLHTLCLIFWWITSCIMLLSLLLPEQMAFRDIIELTYVNNYLEVVLVQR